MSNSYPYAGCTKMTLTLAGTLPRRLCTPIAGQIRRTRLTCKSSLYPHRPRSYPQLTDAPVGKGVTHRCLCALIAGHLHASFPLGFIIPDPRLVAFHCCSTRTRLRCKTPFCLHHPHQLTDAPTGTTPGLLAFSSSGRFGAQDFRASFPLIFTILDAAYK